MNPQPQSIREVLSEFPALFGLRGYREDVFRISPAIATPTVGNIAVVHIDVWSGGVWRRFGKEAATDLRAKITPIPAKEGARAINVLSPGAWVRTDETVSNILDFCPATNEQPHTGRHWWRVQTLLHEFGVTV